jgi:hypothetical protein
MPLLILAILLFGLLSFVYPLLAYYLWREWNTYHGTAADAYAHRCLYGAIALLLFIFFGRFLMKMLLSKKDRRRRNLICLKQTNVIP